MPKKQNSWVEKIATTSDLGEKAKQDVQNDNVLSSKIDSSSAVETNTYKSCSILEPLQYYSTERAIAIEDRLTAPLFSKDGEVLLAKDVVHAEGLQRSPPKPALLASKKTNAVDTKSKACITQNWDEVDADLLLWKLCDYNLSPYHGFSSSTPEDLKARIEKALVANDIEFSLEPKFAYRCRAVCDFSSVKFTLRVAKLQSPCQKIVGETHVVEFTKCRCSSPVAWQAVFINLATNLKDVLKVKSQNLRTSCTDSKSLLGKLSSSKGDDACMIKDDLGNWLSSLLEMISEHDADDGVVELASVVASLSSDSEGKHEESLKVSDVHKLLSLLNHRSVDVRRSMCTVIGNVARAGLFSDLSDLEKEDIIRCLSRCVQSIGPNEMLTNRLKREAIEALGVMQGVFFPKNDSTKDLTRKTLQACAASCDIRLSACATEALTNFRKKDISTG